MVQKQRVTNTPKKMALGGLGAVLGAASAHGIIYVGTDTLSVSVPSNAGNASDGWDVDSASTTASLNRAFESNFTTDYSFVQFSADAKINIAGSLSFAKDGGKLKLFNSGDNISSGAGLVFGTDFYAHRVAAFTATAGQGGAAASEAASNALFDFIGNASGSGILGFRYNDGSQDNYGWANVTWDIFSISINVPYWSDTGSIEAGQVPEPAQVAVGLGALALGAAGLRRWRNGKSKAGTAS